MEKFKTLGLGEETLKLLKEQGIVEPTEIQSKAIPFVLEGRDVIAVSATGSGKTLVFASAIVEKLIPNGKVQSIVLTPTRELAEQVSDAIASFADRRLNILSVYGGVPIENQMRKIKNADVVVGTPGRILDHLNRRSLKLKDVQILILDEFDRMLDMGFHRDVDKIIKELPKQRQTLLFSATTSGVENLLEKYTNNATEITAETLVDHSKLKQVFYDVPSNMKFSLLVHLLKEEAKVKSQFVLIFCSTRRNVDFVTENLNQNKINAKAIHGGMEQKKRIKVLREFHEDGVGILVCTDVAARGLDIKGVSHVYNYDLPREVDDYIHRIGRTARAGEKGIAVNILSSKDYDIFSDILNKKKMQIDELPLPFIQRVVMERTETPRDSRGSSRDRDSSRGRPRGMTRSRSGLDSRGRSSGRESSNGRRESSRVEMFDAVCKKCGKKCQVPFKPNGSSGVSCSDCFVRREPRSNSSRTNGSRRRESSRDDSRRSSTSRMGSSRNRSSSTRDSPSRSRSSEGSSSRRGSPIRRSVSRVRRD